MAPLDPLRKPSASLFPSWRLLAGLLVTPALVLAQTGSSFAPIPLTFVGSFSPTGVSADGTVVVGGSLEAGQGNKAKRWRQGLGFDNPSPDPSLTASWASGVSADGTVVSGGSGHAAFGDLEGWMRYGNSVGHVGSASGHDTSDCLGVSADGVVSVGYGGHQSNPNLFEAGLYTEQDEWTNLGFLPGGTNSKALAADADGSVIVGWSNDATLSVKRAFRWTAGTGMVSLGNLPSGTECEANGCNADGSVVVGSDYVVDAQFQSTQTAWRWTASGGMQSLGQLPGGSGSAAAAVSPDGQLVVGWADDGGGYAAFVWDAGHGMRRLIDVLAAQGVPGLGGWAFGAATCVASDAPYRIAGEGSNGTSSFSGWVVALDLTEDPWLDLGDALAGTAGEPSLVGNGTLVAGSAASVELTSARPSSLAVLFLSTTADPTPFKGGFLVPVPVLATFEFGTSGAGALSLDFTPVPPGIPSGLELVWQFGIQDPAAVHGAALSNALLSTFP